jgi:hypothetical protein
MFLIFLIFCIVFFIFLHVFLLCLVHNVVCFFLCVCCLCPYLISPSLMFIHYLTVCHRNRIIYDMRELPLPSQWLPTYDMRQLPLPSQWFPTYDMRQLPLPSQGLPIYYMTQLPLPSQGLPTYDARPHAHPQIKIKGNLSSIPTISITKVLVHYLQGR